MSRMSLRKTGVSNGLVDVRSWYLRILQVHPSSGSPVDQNVCSFDSVSLSLQTTSSVSLEHSVGTLREHPGKTEVTPLRRHVCTKKKTEIQRTTLKKPHVHHRKSVFRRLRCGPVNSYLSVSLVWHSYPSSKTAPGQSIPPGNLFPLHLPQTLTPVTLEPPDRRHRTSYLGSWRGVTLERDDDNRYTRTTGVLKEDLGVFSKKVLRDGRVPS